MSGRLGSVSNSCGVAEILAREDLPAHSFTELVERATSFALERLTEIQENIIEELQTSASRTLIKGLQMIQLQKAIMAVGMFSMFETILQDSLEVENSFAEAHKILDDNGEDNLRELFITFQDAVNVLKHGKRRSYNRLLDKSEKLPFRLKKPEKHFFFE